MLFGIPPWQAPEEIGFNQNQVSIDSADHEGEDERGRGGLDDPEGDQGGRLDSSEQVHLEIAK